MGNTKDMSDSKQTLGEDTANTYTFYVGTYKMRECEMIMALENGYMRCFPPTPEHHTMYRSSTWMCKNIKIDKDTDDYFYHIKTNYDIFISKTNIPRNRLQFVVIHCHNENNTDDSDTDTDDK
jgi:hypothetical protein